jgi:hypothetical protein
MTQDEVLNKLRLEVTKLYNLLNESSTVTENDRQKIGLVLWFMLVEEAWKGIVDLWRDEKL